MDVVAWRLPSLVGELIKKHAILDLLQGDTLVALETSALDLYLKQPVLRPGVVLTEPFSDQPVDLTLLVAPFFW